MRTMPLRMSTNTPTMAATATMPQKQPRPTTHLDPDPDRCCRTRPAAHARPSVSAQSRPLPLHFACRASTVPTSSSSLPPTSVPASFRTACSDLPGADPRNRPRTRSLRLSAAAACRALVRTCAPLFPISRIDHASPSMGCLRHPAGRSVSRACWTAIPHARPGRPDCGRARHHLPVSPGRLHNDRKGSAAAGQGLARRQRNSCWPAGPCRAPCAGSGTAQGIRAIQAGTGKHGAGARAAPAAPLSGADR